MTVSATIVCVSDTHCRPLQGQLPHGDILLHAGDFSNTGTLAEASLPASKLLVDRRLCFLVHEPKLAEQQSALLKASCNNILCAKRMHLHLLASALSMAQLAVVASGPACCEAAPNNRAPKLIPSSFLTDSGASLPALAAAAAAQAEGSNCWQP